LNVLSCDGLALDRVSRTVTARGQEVELTVREFSLLELLMRSPERVFTRTQILEHVWGYDFDPQTNVVDVYIRRLRKKLEVACGDRAIETIRGVGYRMGSKPGGDDRCFD
ncbi:MAG: winged helix-turn-helix domain-containing protein, partial [Desulfobacterales bacterium]|nr:winged helix-turn-helix domain-containing protein [Desulfobacterales bacterium]